MGWAGATPGPGNDSRGKGHSPGAAGAGAPRSDAEASKARPGVAPGEGSRWGARGGDGEASPCLPGRKRRRGPAVAKENALPGHGRGVMESNGGREGPKARRGVSAQRRRWSAVVALRWPEQSRAGPGGGHSRLLWPGLAETTGCSRWLLLPGPLLRGQLLAGALPPLLLNAPSPNPQCCDPPGRLSPSRRRLPPTSSLWV